MAFFERDLIKANANHSDKSREATPKKKKRVSAMYDGPGAQNMREINVDHSGGARISRIAELRSALDSANLGSSCCRAGLCKQPEKCGSDFQSARSIHHLPTHPSS